MTTLPDFSDIEAAARTITGQAVRTPLIRSQLLDDELGARIYFKAECLQRTGSFKFRGAYNAMSHMPQSARTTGVLACSSGNHAQGVAEAARLFGYDAKIVMPKDAPQAKKDRTMRSGAEIVEYDRYSEDREGVTEQLAHNSGAPIIHPYENFHVIAGQGTVGLEMAQDMNALGLIPDHVLVCTGGGGLLAGTLLATRHHFPNVEVHPVEPEGYDDQARSHASGARMRHNATEPTVCDAIMTEMPGENSFAICKDNLASGLAVSDAEALAAVAFAFRELKLVVEPGGAVTLAALLAGRLDVKGKTILATLTGGNIDETVMAHALAQ